VVVEFKFGCGWPVEFKFDRLDWSVEFNAGWLNLKLVGWID
jgi:hypothetical protein